MLQRRIFGLVVAVLALTLSAPAAEAQKVELGLDLAVWGHAPTAPGNTAQNEETFVQAPFPVARAGYRFSNVLTVEASFGPLILADVSADVGGPSSRRAGLAVLLNATGGEYEGVFFLAEAGVVREGSVAEAFTLGIGARPVRAPLQPRVQLGTMYVGGTDLHRAGWRFFSSVGVSFFPGL